VGTTALRKKGQGTTFAPMLGIDGKQLPVDQPLPESGCRRLRLTRSGLWKFKSSPWYCAKTWLNTGRTLSIDSFQAALHQLELSVDNLTTNTP
jgi:hypothetical protein